MRERFDLCECRRTIDNWSKRSAGSLPAGKHFAQLGAVKLKTWTVVEKLAHHPRKLARSFAVGSRCIDDAGQRTEHSLRPLVITPVLLHRFDHRNECSQCSHVVIPPP